MPQSTRPDPATDEAAPKAAVPTATEAPASLPAAQERPGIAQWLLFLGVVLLCLLVAFMSLTGLQQIPLP